MSHEEFNESESEREEAEVNSVGSVNMGIEL